MERFFVNQINNNCVVVGGVRLLGEFAPEIVVVKVVGGEVRITGQSLKIARFNAKEIEVTGTIENVETLASRVRKSRG